MANGTRKSHLAVAIARACLRSGKRGRFFNVVDLVNKLDAEARADRQGRTADLLSRLDLSGMVLGPMAAHAELLDELGYLPFAQTGGQLLFHLHQPPLRTHVDPRDHEPRLRRMAERLRRCQDDNRAPGSRHASLRDR